MHQGFCAKLLKVLKAEHLSSKRYKSTREQKAPNIEEVYLDLSENRFICSPINYCYFCPSFFHFRDTIKRNPPNERPLGTISIYLSIYLFLPQNTQKELLPVMCLRKKSRPGEVKRILFYK